MPSDRQQGLGVGGLGIGATSLRAAKQFAPSSTWRFSTSGFGLSVGKRLKKIGYILASLLLVSGGTASGDGTSWWCPNKGCRAGPALAEGGPTGELGHYRPVDIPANCPQEAEGGRQ